MNAADQARSTAEAIARRSYGKLVAFLAARTRDVAAAEDALSEAFAAALADWPLKGCPTNPEAWLLTVARRRTIDVARGKRRHEIASVRVLETATGLDAAADCTGMEIPDRRLALMFACAHPAVEVGIHSPLILQVVLGMDAATIASAFLTSPAAMGKRLVRAKDKIRRAGIPFRIPERAEMSGRLEAVLDAIYAAFSEGWSDPAGDDAIRRELTDEALYLARLVTQLLPGEPEASGLLALLLHAEARRKARRVNAEYTPFEEQDMALWEFPMIMEAESLLRTASETGSIGRYQLEASLQSAHVYRRQTGHNNWADIVRLYDVLFALSGSPVVAINRALAIAETESPLAAVHEIDRLRGNAKLSEYQPYWAARAELLSKTGAADEAFHAYEMAIGLERDPAVRRFLLKRQRSLKK